MKTLFEMEYLYKIANWSTYETHETRKLVRLDWIKIPNKHDGLGFRLVMAEKDAGNLYAAWILLVQLASKADRDNRGELIRDGIPLSARAMSLMTGFAENCFSRALTFFSQPSIGWLIAQQWQTELPLSPGNLPLSPDDPPKVPGRMEWKGMEGNGREDRLAGGSPGESIPLVLQTDEFRKAWADWKAYRVEIKAPLKPMSLNAALSQMAKMGPERAVAAIRFTIYKAWRGLKEPEGPDARQFASKPVKAAETPNAEPLNWRERMAAVYGPDIPLLADDRPFSIRSAQTQADIIRICCEIP